MKRELPFESYPGYSEEGQKLFDDCNFKGTFANCNPAGCIKCQEEKDIANVFEVSDTNSNVVYPTPTDKTCLWIRKKLGVLFGTRCPRCYSKNFETNYLLNAGVKYCQDCGHRWGHPVKGNNETTNI